MARKLPAPAGGRPKRRPTARRGGTPRAIPGAAQVEISQSPEFIAWRERWGVLGQSSAPEFICFRWLEKRGYVAGIDFQYLAHRPGVGSSGGQQVDFIIGGWLVWAVQGVYFHHRDPSQGVRDEMNRAMLESAGYVVVFILDTDIVDRTDYTLQIALLGAEMPGAREGLQY